MRSFLLFGCFFLFLDLGCFSQCKWTGQYQSTSLKALQLFDDKMAIAVGSYGIILRSSDAGETWSTVQTCNYYSELNAISLAGATIGYVAGGNGVVLKTTDSGQSWESLSTGIDDNLVDIQFINATVGYAVSYGGYLIKTVDGGTTWTQYRPGGERLTSLFFLNESTGFVTGGSNTLRKTTDGGKTWSPIEVQHIGFNITINDIYFTDSETGYAVGDQGLIMKTIDGGTTWPKLANPSGSFMNRVYFTDTQTGYAVGNCCSATMVKTTNAGETWEPVSVGSSGNLYGLCFTSNNTGFVVGSDTYGNGRLLLKTLDGGANWDNIADITSNSLSQLNFVSDQIGYVLADNATVYKTKDGGTSWNNISFPYGEPPYALHFFDTEHGVALCEYTGAISDSKSLYKTSDGGKTWVGSRYSIDEATLQAASFPTRLTWYSIAFYGDVYKTTDAGGTWTKTSGLPALFYPTIHFVDEQTGYVAAWYGNLFKTSDGGKSWDLLNSNTDANLQAIQFINPSVGFVGGGNGVILKTRNAGKDWSMINIPEKWTVQHIYFEDELSGIITAGGNSVFQTTDGGKSWQQLDVYVPQPIHTFDFGSNHSLFLMGDAGMILKIVPGTLPCKPNFIRENDHTVACLGSIEYAVAATAPSFQWKLSGGGTLVTEQNKATVTWTHPGTYQLTATQANECGPGEPALIEIQVESPPPTPTIQFDSPYLQPNKKTLLTSSSQTGNQWYLDGTLIPGATEASYEVQKVGRYSLAVSNHCGIAFSSPLSIQLPTGIGPEIDSKIAFSPNPATSIVNIKLHSSLKIISIRFVNVLGEVYSLGNLDSKGGDISISKFPSGTYLLMIETKEGIYRNKLVILND